MQGTAVTRVLWKEGKDEGWYHQLLDNDTVMVSNREMTRRAVVLTPCGDTSTGSTLLRSFTDPDPLAENRGSEHMFEYSGVHIVSNDLIHVIVGG